MYLRPAPFHITGPICKIGLICNHRHTAQILYTTCPKPYNTLDPGMFPCSRSLIFILGLWSLRQAAEGVQNTKSSKSGQCCKSGPICNCGQNVELLLPATKPLDTAQQPQPGIAITINLWLSFLLYMYTLCTSFSFIPIGHAVVFLAL